MRKNISKYIYIYNVKKVIEINDEDAQFLSDYKTSHGVLPAKFIDMAIRERIIKIKQEIKLQENAFINK